MLQAPLIDCDLTANATLFQIIPGVLRALQQLLRQQQPDFLSPHTDPFHLRMKSEEARACRNERRERTA